MRGWAQDPAPAVPLESAPAAASEKPTEQRVAALEAKILSLSQEQAATKAALDKAAKLKFSGYVQGRYERHDDADFGVDEKGNPRGTNRFLVRRARLKTVYAGDMSEFVLQIDAIGEGGIVRDAEASLVVDGATIGVPGGKDLKLKLTAGQFKIPFGHEILQSTSVREMPERTLMIRRLFPGERDRGLRFTADYKVLRFAVAIINGNMTTDPIYKTFDQTSFKDVVGRVGADFKWLAFGGSWHVGHTLKTTLGKPASGAMPAVPTSYERYARLRLGGDAQFQHEVPSIGQLILRGELVWTRDRNMDFSGVPAASCLNTSSLGWQGTVVQNIGKRFGAVVRVDQFDENRGVASACDARILSAAAQDKVTTVGGGVFVLPSANFKFTLAYDHIVEQGARRIGNDIITGQLQAMF